MVTSSHHARLAMPTGRWTAHTRPGRIHRNHQPPRPVSDVHNIECPRMDGLSNSLLPPQRSPPLSIRPSTRMQPFISHGPILHQGHLASPPAPLPIPITCQPPSQPRRSLPPLRAAARTLHGVLYGRCRTPVPQNPSLSNRQAGPAARCRRRAAAAHALRCLRWRWRAPTLQHGLQPVDDLGEAGAQPRVALPAILQAGVRGNVVVWHRSTISNKQTKGWTLAPLLSGYPH